MTAQNAQVSTPAGTVGTIEVRSIAGPGYLAVVLPGAPESSGVLRSLLRRSLGRYASPELLICASELASNAIEHTRSGRPGGRFAVTAQVETASVVLVSVLDEGAGTPQDRSARGLPEEHGRGLDIVGALSIESGAAPASAGRLAWFRIKVTDAAAGRLNRDGAETLRRDGRETAGRDAHRDAALARGCRSW
jgi:serine/threonine-protein kinase RsbW